MRIALLSAALMLPFAAAAQADTDFHPSGDVVFRVGGVATGASYDDARVIGPSVNLEEGEGGAWVGDIGGNPVALEISETRIAGAGVNLHVTREKDRMSVRGIVFNRRVTFEIRGKNVNGRVGDCSFDLGRSGPGLFAGKIGCSRGAEMPRTASAELRLAGTATDKPPPYPQLELALVAVLLL